MFTGIIQAIGKVREPEKLGNGVRLMVTLLCALRVSRVLRGC